MNQIPFVNLALMLFVIVLILVFFLVIFTTQGNYLLLKVFTRGLYNLKSFVVDIAAMLAFNIGVIEGYLKNENRKVNYKHRCCDVYLWLEQYKNAS